MQPCDGVWKMTNSSEHGEDPTLLKLTTQAGNLTGEISSPRLGTHDITNVVVSGRTLNWTIALTNPVVLKLEMTVDLNGDGLSGQARAGPYGVSTLRGARGTDSDWVPWPGPHSHRTAVLLPDGSTIVAVSYDSADPYRRERLPDFGLYLDPLWKPSWPYAHIAWPDFGVPDQPDTVAPALCDLRERAHRGQRVELGCLGGHGRTGSALAWLVVLTGHPPGDAVAWVRHNYCKQAVETPAQEQFIAGLDG